MRSRGGSSAGACVLVVLAAVVGAGLVGPTAQSSWADAVAPNRVLDTRIGLGAAAGRLQPGVMLVLPVGPSVAAGAGAASLNLTAVDATSAGYLTVWPCGRPVPATSILNFVPGRVSANHALVGIGAGGVCLAASQPVHVVADLMGWFVTADDFEGAAPTRLVDTRVTRSPLAAQVERRVDVTSGAGYGTGAAAVALNVTVVNTSADGYVVVYPCGARPLASTVNFRAGEIVANLTVVAFSGGEVCVFANVATDVVVDTFGWSANRASLRLATPARLLDTRNRTGWSGGQAQPGADVVLRVAGRSGVPNDAAAVLLTLTATGGAGDGFVTAWPCDLPRPVASVLNLRPGYLGSNLVHVPLSAASGSVCLHASSATHLVADAVGWQTGGPARTPPPPDPVPDPAHFGTVPPGNALPSEAACAAAVRAAGEVRAGNAAPNATRGTQPNTTYPQVTGNFTGTTDQILQWVACKWGIDEDVVRAQIAKESWWKMSTVGDNGQSFGLGQVRQPYHGSAFVDDNAKRSSAYNVDYTYAAWRSCFEGNETWLNTVERGATYVAGDAWGCAGVWFAGRWLTAPAQQYIAEVKDYVQRRIWTTPEFLAG